MSLKISAIQSVSPIDTGSIAPASADGGAFHDVLSGVIQQVEGSRADAAKSVEQFLSGEGEDLHSTILATQRAELEFQMFLQVRNKVVSAYQEVMKMQM